MHTRSLERRVGASSSEKATLFFQYSIMNKLLANFCAALTKNSDLISRFYFPGCVLSSAEHSSMFLLQLNTLESLNFSAIWTDGSTSKDVEELGPQRTIILQSAPTNSPPSGRLAAPVIQEKPVIEAPKPIVEPRDTTATLFGGLDASAPLTFSLKPKASATPSFTHAFVPMVPASSTPPAPTTSAPASVDNIPFQAARISTPPPQESPSPVLSPASTPIHRSQTITPPPVVEPPKRSSQSLPPSNPVPERASTPNAELMSIAAEVEAPMLANSAVPGSAKKRAKKRTIDL